MSLSVAFSSQAEARLLQALKEMYTESLFDEPPQSVYEDMATVVAEMLQLIAMCREYVRIGKERRYEMEVYVDASKVAWQYCISQK